MIHALVSIKMIHHEWMEIVSWREALRISGMAQIERRTGKVRREVTAKILSVLTWERIAVRVNLSVRI